VRDKLKTFMEELRDRSREKFQAVNDKGAQ
jgi:hypothetical protein